MKKILPLTFVVLFVNLYIYGQCDYTQSGQLKDPIAFNSIIDCDNGDVTLNDMNAQNNSDASITFTEDVTLNSLSVLFANGDNQVLFIIPDGITVTILDGLSFSGQLNKDKLLEVNGTLNVGGTLDFGDVDFEIDGTGTISAGRVQGAENTSCEATGTCPTFDVDDCDGTAGSLCGEDALPIELKSFSASKSGQNINLDWITAKEENFSHFEIERSVDQKNWEQIGLVQGMGESMSDVHYDFTDRKSPFGVIYYRLNAVDIDASFEYSPVVKVEVGFEGKLAVSPNPVKDASNLKIQVPSEFRDNLAYVGLFDLSGITVQEFRNFNTDGTLQINQKLKSGMYILKVNHNGLQENIRVIIQ